jgi:hypothetical protein
MHAMSLLCKNQAGAGTHNAPANDRGLKRLHLKDGSRRREAPVADVAAVLAANKVDGIGKPIGLCLRLFQALA